MNVLFLHRNFPGQFMHLARHLAQDPANHVVFITARWDRSIPNVMKALYHAREVVTYVSRRLEPYRGFPQFKEACGIILDRRPGCHVVVVGQDRVFYGSPLPDGKTYRQQALETNRLDASRVHFTRYIPYDLKDLLPRQVQLLQEHASLKPSQSEP